MQAVKPIFKLNGTNTVPFRDWSKTRVLATFDKTGGQANISTDRIRFVNENAKLIRDYIEAGANGQGAGIFEGMPFEIDIVGQAGAFNAFKGYLDFTTYKQITLEEVECNIKQDQGLNSLAERMSGITYGYLEDIGIINNNDYIDFPVIKQKLPEDEAAELLSLAIMIFLMARELADVAKDIAKDIANTTSHGVGGVTGAAGAAVYGVAAIALNLVYAALMIIYLITLAQQVFELVFKPVRYWRGIQWRKLMEKASVYLGYSYSSSISDLDNVLYLPSKTKQGRLAALSPSTTAKGIPTPSDFGYRVSEQVDLINTAFEARIAVKNGVIHQEPLLNDSFWLAQSSFTIPDVLDETVQYNLDECKALRLVSFETDLNDEWTIENFVGTNYEIKTFKNNVVNQRNVLLKGYAENRIPMALPNRKEGLNALEISAATFLSAIDGLINFFGGNSNLAGNITSRVGTLIVTGTEISVGKLIKFEQGGSFNYRIPQNHRQTWSAKYLWDNYISENSFVDHNFRSQKRKFENITIPFGLSDYLALINNSYCFTQSGQSAKVEQLEWEFDSDTAVISGWVREKYAGNLTEFKKEGSTDDV